MKSLSFSCALAMIFGCAAFGQSSEIHHHNFTFGFGGAVPTGSDTAYLGAAPMISLGYGYRFNRLFQADAGIQAIFGAAHNQNPVATDAGYIQGGDHEYMAPLGGRVILPLHLPRIEVSLGGGAMYLHYSETAPSNGGYYTPTCYSCTSRAGWGGYGMANASWFPDSNQSFHIGTTVQFVSASTNGQSLGSIPGVRTSDHWTNIFLEAGLSF